MFVSIWNLSYFGFEGGFFFRLYVALPISSQGIIITLIYDIGFDS